MLQQHERRVVIAAVVGDAELAVGVVGGAGLAVFGHHGVGGEGTEAGAASVVVQEQERAAAVGDDVFDGLLQLVAVFGGAERETVEKGVTVHADDRGVGGAGFAMGEDDEILAGDDVVIDVDAEPVGRGEQIDDGVLRVLFFEGGESVGGDFDEVAFVPDELIAEDERARAGHVALDGTVFEERFKLGLGEEDVVVHRLHREEVARRIDEAARLGERVGFEEDDRLGREGAFDGGGGRALEDVATGGLGRKIGKVEGAGLEFERFGAGDGNVLGAEGVEFVGVVGEDDERRGDAEQVADVGDAIVVAVVLFEAHRGVGLEGGKLIEGSLDEHAVAGFTDVADAAAFLHEVEKDAAAFFGDDLEGAFELLNAIAVAAAEGFAGDAGGVDAGVESFGTADVAEREGDDVVLVYQVLEDVGAKRTVARVERTGGEVKRGAVERAFVQNLGGESAAGRMLQLRDERREIGRWGAVGGGVERNDLGHAWAAESGIQRTEDR